MNADQGLLQAAAAAKLLLAADRHLGAGARAAADLLALPVRWSMEKSLPETALPATLAAAHLLEFCPCRVQMRNKGEPLIGQLELFVRTLQFV